MKPLTHPSLFLVLLALTLVVSPLSSKAMGLAWLLLVLAGAWAANRHRGPFHPPETACARGWLAACTGALLLKAVAALYWGDPWGERHGEWRLFIGALALYGLLGAAALPRKTLAVLAHALSLGSAAGLLWVLAFGRDGVPTHPIPWAGSMAMVAAVLLALGLKSDFPAPQRGLWWTGSLLACMAVLSSQSRGAYGIVLWWLALSLHHLWTHRRNRPGRSLAPPGKGRWALLVAGAAGLLVLSQTPVFERPAQGIASAIHELQVSRESMTAGANSSVGARLYMWQQSLTAIGQSPWIGHGHDGRKHLLQQWANAAQSAEIGRLGHVHNEYLHQWLDHGMLGLGSQLAYLAGLVGICAWLLKNRQHTAALAIAGIAFVHFTASLSNVNFAHNYYTASLAFLIGLSLWLTRLERP